ncbi:DNA repair protein RadC [Vibrio vulnificus]|nr:DNA repair protein RadC [Vibrio vulnificus]
MNLPSHEDVKRYLNQIGDEGALYIAEQVLISRLVKTGDELTSPQLTKQLLRTILGCQPRERFLVLFLDNQHRYLAHEVLFEGTIDAASVYPREVVKRALAHNCAALMFAHNHPSGSLTPSQADRNITRRLTDALALIDVRVLDHFIVGHTNDGIEITSFAERGLM